MEYMGVLRFLTLVNYTWIEMAKSAPKGKSARETLIDSVTRIQEEARQRLSKEEFRHVEEKFHDLANKVRASRG